MYSMDCQKMFKIFTSKLIDNVLNTLYFDIEKEFIQQTLGSYIWRNRNNMYVKGTICLKCSSMYSELY